MTLDYLLSYPSEKRIQPLILALQGTAPETFWPLFLEWYPSCDDTWEQRDLILALLGRVPYTAYLSGPNRSWFASLPPKIAVYRGCSWRKMAGLSWTTDKRTAKQYARGHRGREVAEPVICSGVIPKTKILAAVTDRDESEVILNPADVEGMRAAKFRLEKAPA